MKLRLILAIIFIFSIAINGISQDTINPCKLEVPSVVCMDCKTGNDYLFIISSNCQLKDFTLTVFNRWGNELFKTKDRGDFWDASEVKSGTFYWTIQGKYYDNQKIDLSGHVSKL